MWSTAQRYKDVMSVLNETRSVGYGRQCSLVWSCLEKGIRF